ncbi:MAG: SUMF1/EgtB/PvdO family nonheme iron enzyme [Bacteroidota bacterium]
MPFEPEMVFVKGGQFWMGYKAGRDGEDKNMEASKPLTKVSIRDFHIGKYPVTNEEYCAFLNDYGSERVKDGEHQGQIMIADHKWGLQLAGKWKAKRGYDKHPVIRVSWYGASEYCKWLSQKTGKNYHLPSEAQWEYAARGGWESEDFMYAGSNDLDEVAWHYESSKRSTQKVGTRPKSNELGIYDMSGNVWEWCTDCWYESYEGLPKDGSAYLVKDKGDCSRRVLRGGSWVSYVTRYLRSADRYRCDSNVRDFNYGFRVAQD